MTITIGQGVSPAIADSAVRVHRALRFRRYGDNPRYGDRSSNSVDMRTGLQIDMGTGLQIPSIWGQIPSIWGQVFKCRYKCRYGALDMVDMGTGLQITLRGGDRSSNHVVSTAVEPGQVFESRLASMSTGGGEDRSPCLLFFHSEEVCALIRIVASACTTRRGSLGERWQGSPESSMPVRSIM